MIGPSDLFHPSPAPHFKTFQVFVDTYTYIYIYLFMRMEMDGAHIKNMSQIREASIANILLGKPPETGDIDIDHCVLGCDVVYFWDVT
jgi:hypothetical protein